MPQVMPQFPLSDADKCVKCALCLPHCPTYRESLDEGESPRGRIALMQGMATGALTVTHTLTGHLDRCLDCRACEAVCPAEVPYGKLIDAARRELLRHGHSEPLMTRWFAWWMRSPVRLRVLHVALRCAQRIGLPELAAISPRFGRLAGLLPSVSRPRRWRPLYAASENSADVQLFLGCIARVVQPEATAASIRVLNALGYSVRLPEHQTCCGALDLHAGRSEQAAALARKNLEAFTPNDDRPLLHTASGCGATLAEYPLLVNTAGAAKFSARAHDFCEFVAQAPRLQQIQFRSWPARVLVHNPCTLKNVLKSERYVEQVLRRIPGLHVEVLPAATGCCGAAGSYVLNEPQIADRLAEQTVDAIAARSPDAVVTSNVGCALHLRPALQRRRLDIPVLHPAELLVRQLPGAQAAGL
jgi:glycolate oxidase iron-sulfur subunit